MATPLTNTVPAEPVVCVTRDRVPSGWETVERSWTVAELRETWPEGTDDVVDGLLKHIEALRSQLTASGESMAIELRVRETLKEHIHDLSKYADHMHGCTYPASTCTCGFLELMQKGIAR